MKKLIILLALIGTSFALRAQTIDTAFHRMPAARVTPFLNNPRTDTAQITHIALLSGHFDYAERTITLNYALSNDAQDLIAPDVIMITGADFTAGLSAPNKLMYFFRYLAAHVPGITYQ